MTEPVFMMFFNLNITMRSIMMHLMNLMSNVHEVSYEHPGGILMVTS